MSESLDGFIEMLLRSGLISQVQLNDVHRQLAGETNASSSKDLVMRLADSGHLSDFQAHEVKEGNVDKLVVGDYVILHPVGRGGMGLVRMNVYDDMAQEKTVASEEQLTKNGQLLGTVDFMAPEQAVDPHTADARSSNLGK